MLIRLDSANIQWLLLPNHLQNLGLYRYIPKSHLSVLSHLIRSQWTVLGQRTNQENPKKWFRSKASAKGKQINWRHVTSSAWLGPFDSFPVCRTFLQGKMQFIDGQNRKISSEDTRLSFRTIKYTYWSTKNSEKNFRVINIFNANRKIIVLFSQRHQNERLCRFNDMARKPLIWPMRWPLCSWPSKNNVVFFFLSKLMAHV